MTVEAGKLKKRAAQTSHEEGYYEDAVSHYVQAAYEYVGAHGLKPHRAGMSGLQNLSVGAACLRYLGRSEECRSVCWQGVYISEMLGEKAVARPRESYDYDQATRGTWFEFAGDFRLIGDLPGTEDPYSRAEEVYTDAGDPERVEEGEFIRVAHLFRLLIRGTDMDPDEFESFNYPPVGTVTEWLDLKRRQLPEALDRLDECDEWKYVF